MRRFNFNLKHMLVCMAALLSPQFQLAGVYPLVPALFMTGFVCGVNRSLLFLCSICGLLILAPVSVMVKYALVILLSAALVWGLEQYTGHCRTHVAGALCGGVTVVVGLCWNGLHLPGTSGLVIRICEGILVTGFIYVVSRLVMMIPDWEPRSEMPVVMYAPGGRRLNEYAESFEKLSRTYRFLQALQRGRETDVQERATELGEYCPYREDLIEQVQLVFEKAHLNMAWYNRLQENRDVIAQQLDAMAYIMEDCANEETDVTAKEGKITASMRYAWKELGVLVEQLRILENSHGKWQVLFQGRTRGSKCISVREMARLISGVSGRGFAPAKDSKALLGTESQSLIFCENSRLTAGYGVARAVREDEQVSGDNFSFQMLDNGCCVMAVSDGMGSGYAACKESEMVIDLIEKFMEAGFLPDTALRMMNSAMVTHGEHNLFSTVDLMRLDLDSGEAAFYKIGAATTFIRHGKEVRMVTQKSMPVGVFVGQQVPKVTEQLADGDFVIMVTDGVLEHLHVRDAGETICEVIRGIDTNNAAEFSRLVLEQVLLYTGGRVRDDMTVLTAGIWSR